MESGQPQIEDLHSPFRREHQVRRLDVAVYEAMFVGRLQAEGRLPGNSQASAVPNRPEPAGDFPQVEPFDKLHDQHQPPVDLAGVVGADDVGWSSRPMAFISRSKRTTARGSSVRPAAAPSGRRPDRAGCICIAFFITCMLFIILFIWKIIIVILLIMCIIIWSWFILRYMCMIKIFIISIKIIFVIRVWHLIFCIRDMPFIISIIRKTILCIILSFKIIF